MIIFRARRRLIFGLTLCVLIFLFAVFAEAAIDKTATGGEPAGRSEIAIEPATGNTNISNRSSADRDAFGGRTAPFDFNGDGFAEPAVFRPSTGGWLIMSGITTQYGYTWGAAADKIVPVDFDGDTKTDVAIYRPSEGRWYILNSSTSTFTTTFWGISTDIPTPADYDGDNKADIAVFRPSDGNWWLNRSTGGTLVIPYGQNGDVPAVGDYDGDSKADIGVFRPSNGVWYLHRSTAGDFGYQFGFGSTRSCRRTMTATARPTSRSIGRRPLSGLL